MMIRQIPVAAGLLAALWLQAARPADATLISGTGIEGLAAFTGDFAYDPSSSILAISLTNTTPTGNGGFLTAFAFNNPNDRITGITFTATDLDFALLGGPEFDDGVFAPPLGRFDIGASVTGSWLAGGGVQDGIPLNETETFRFTLSCGGSLCGNALAPAAFFSALSAGAQSRDLGAQFFAARVRGIDPGDRSDKVLGAGVPPPDAVIPEPASLVLIGSGLAGLAMRRRFGPRRG